MVNEMSDKILYIGNLDSPFQKQMYSFLLESGFRVIHFFEKPPYGLLKKIIMLTKLFYLLIISDIVFIEFLSDYAWIISRINKITKKPLIVRCHRGELYEYWEKHRERVIEAAKASTTIICVHEDYRDRLIKLVDGIEDKVMVIYNGVDTNYFKPMDKSKERSNEWIIAGSLGYLIPRKGFLELIQVIEELLKENIKIKLRIGGKGPLYEKIHKEIVSRGLKDYIYLDGFIPRDKIVSWYNNLDLFIINSYDESGPLVLLEAMSCGLPVISSRVGLAKNLLDISWTFKPGDLDSLKKLIKKFSHLSLEEKTRIGAANREKIVRSFDYRKQFRKILEIFKNLSKS